MELLRGVERINNILNHFLEDFDCSAEMSSDFCYWHSKNLINYTLAIPNNEDKWFQEFANTLMPELKCDSFLLAFFHELGHHETIDDIDDDIYAYCEDIKDEINMEDRATRENNFKYFNLPVEKIATEWGLTYMKTHEKEVADLWNTLQPALYDFYILNNISI